MKEGGVDLGAEPVVVFDRVTREFRSFWGRRRVVAVRDLTLEIRRGEIFGLLGPNGSGKTTTLQMLLGLLAPTSGRVSVFGAPPGEPPVLRRIGYLPEEFGASGFLTGEETLRYYGGFYGLPSAEVRRRTEDLLERLDLLADRRRPVREYSKGMRRRIGLAQSLLHDPELVVLDEPTNGLDPLGIRAFQAILLELKARGRSVVISSHVLPEMQALCDRVAILHRGRVVVTGRLEDLLCVPGRHLLEVRGQPPPREELAAALAALGLSLEGQRPASSTLEELFVRIVESEGPRKS